MRALQTGDTMKTCLFATLLMLSTTLIPVLGFVTRATSPGVATLSTEHPTPFIDGLGHYHRKVTTTSADAQRYFDQGLAFLYGFNHEAALASVRAACFADPDCAMAY